MDKKRHLKNVLSLFDGISCAHLALLRAGFTIDKYYASELDPYPSAVTRYRFPDTIQLGDVCQISPEDLPEIDLLIGGSPCQDLSISNNNRKGLEGSKSKLFWEYVRLLKALKPKWFVLENVASMSKKDKQVITDTLGVQPIMINSALVSAQSRKRLYWTNIPDIQQPEDKNILLKDIVEADYPEKYLLSENELVYMYRPTKNNYNRWNFTSDTRKDKSSTLMANVHKGVPYNVLLDHVCGKFAVAQRGRYVNEQGQLKDIKGAKTQQRKETSFSEKANTLTSTHKDSMLLDIYAKEGYLIRKFLPSECERTTDRSGMNTH